MNSEYQQTIASSPNRTKDRTICHESRDIALAAGIIAKAEHTCSPMSKENKTNNDILTNIDNGSLLSDKGGNCELTVAAHVISSCVTLLSFMKLSLSKR